MATTAYYVKVKMKMIRQHKCNECHRNTDTKHSLCIFCETGKNIFELDAYAFCFACDDTTGVGECIECDEIVCTVCECDGKYH